MKDQGSDNLSAAAVVGRFKNWFLAMALGVTLVAGWLNAHAFYERKFENLTGNAVWIWKRHRLVADKPVAFFVTRDFLLPRAREFVRIKIAGDPEYTLFFNGAEIGGGRMGAVHNLDVYDVTARARTGRNRVVVALRSERGVGGLLVAIDAGTMLKNVVVTDKSWKVHDRWSALLPEREPSSAGEEPVVWGPPPAGPWNFPREEAKKQYETVRSVLFPASVSRIQTSIPQHKIVSGVAILTSLPAVANVFDFGHVRGRVRIRVLNSSRHVIRFRLANHATEIGMETPLESLVLAGGETAVVDSQERSFRYVIVYDADVEVSVVGQLTF